MNVPPPQPVTATYPASEPNDVIDTTAAVASAGSASGRQPERIVDVTVPVGGATPLINMTGSAERDVLRTTGFRLDDTSPDRITWKLIGWSA